jgi:hypothetical protein
MLERECNNSTYIDNAGCQKRLTSKQREKVNDNNGKACVCTSSCDCGSHLPLVLRPVTA